MNKCQYCKTAHTRNSLYCSVSCSNKSRVPWNKGLSKTTDSRVANYAKNQIGKPSWNKGLSKTTDSRVANHASTLIINGNCKGIASSAENEIKRKQKLSATAKKRKLGGYVQGAGRGKKGWYKGFFCDSSWELAYVVYCLEHNIDIKRNTEKRQYVWQGVVKNYIPDFIVQGIITEVKGFKTEQWLAKLNANPDVKVLYEKDLEHVFEYVKSKYGEDFISLYE